MYNDRFYQKANRIRTNLLLYIDNELQKTKKKNSNKNLLFLKQNPPKVEAFEISLESEIFSNQEEKSSFYCAIEKSEKKNNLYVWGNFYKSFFDLSQSASTCEITPNKKLLNNHNFFYCALRNYYKHKTAPEKSQLAKKNLCCIPERGMKKIKSLGANLCNNGITPDMNNINKCITFKNKRKDNHDEEYLLNLCHQLKIIKKKNNAHHLLRSCKEKPRMKRKTHTTKSKKNPCTILFYNKKVSTHLLKPGNSNVDSSTPIKLHKKKSSASKFYKNSTFSSCICFKVKSTSRLKEKENKTSKKNNH